MPLPAMVALVLAFNAPGRVCEDNCVPAMEAYYACFRVDDPVDRGLCAFDRAVELRLCELHRD